jgi:ATP-dependent Clp protease ATP-binding subunit ClpC
MNRVQGAERNRARTRRVRAAPRPGAEGGTATKAKPKTPALTAFGRDLTELAAKGELDPVIGRAPKSSG